MTCGRTEKTPHSPRYRSVAILKFLARCYTDSKQQMLCIVLIFRDTIVYAEANVEALYFLMITADHEFIV